MDNEIQLISDGHGLAVIGDPTDVERFLSSEGLQSKSLEPRRLSAVLDAGAKAAQASSEISAQSGRWVQLTKDSATAVKQYGLMDSKTPGVSHAMVGKPGDIQQWIQIVKGPGSALANPAMLAGVAGILTQVSMQQQMGEITDYLAKIDEKLDAVLRAQTNQVLARMDGVGLAIKEATTVRDTVGRVSEVTWSKVQNSSATILETQGYALRQLGDLADKIEQESRVGDLAKIAKDAETEVQKYLSVLARCFQLHDAMGVLELDRVLDASPEELDRHRLGLQAARRDRLQLISHCTERMLGRMNAAASSANLKVLLHPTTAPAIVESRNAVAAGVHDFHEMLGIESGLESADATRWVDAAGEQWDKARQTGSEGVDTVKRFSTDTLGHAKSARAKLSNRFSRKPGGDEPDEGVDEQA